MAMHSLGGQAVIEGVMIKSAKHMAIAVRAPSGKITVKKERLHSLAETVPILRLPFLRGILMLFEVLVLGIKALNFSASVATDEKQTKSSWFEILFSLFVSLTLAILIFKFLPLLATQYASRAVTALQNGIIFNFIEGAVKALVFVLYILAISRMKDVRAIFKYHGAEHMAISCFEDGKKLIPTNVRKYSPVHRRCGTTFLFLVILLSIVIYSFIPNSLGFIQKFGYRLLLLPVIAGCSYELLRIGGRIKDNIIINSAIAPGLWIQKMTTAKPNTGQIEVAIASLKAVLKMEKLRQT